MKEVGAMAQRIVTVFGGSGFLGRHLIGRLARTGAVIRVAGRDPEKALFLKTLGDVGQIVPIAANVTHKASVANAVQGADAVINLVGILSEFGRQTFQKVHAEGAAIVAAAAREAGVKRLIHVSALGADPQSPSRYAKTKAAGEAAVREAYPGATILKPSVMFGPEDRFFNLFAELASFTPWLPVFGCPVLPKVTCGGEDALCAVDFYGDGGAKFQPVYVGDVAKAVMTCLDKNASEGKTYELGGPRIYSFKEIMELMLAETRRKRWLVPMPFWLGKFMAFFLGMWPKPLLTRDQVVLLEKDNIAGENAPGFKELGIEPKAAEILLPTYLGRYRPPARQAPREVGNVA